VPCHLLPESSPFHNSMSAVPLIGFVVLADKIHSFHSDIHPQHASSVTTVLSVGHKVKSSFTEGAGMQKADRSATPSITPAKRGATGGGDTVVPARRVTLCYSFNDTVPSHSPDDVTNPFLPSKAMLINQDLVLYHQSHCKSVLQPIYKRLPPEDIMRLFPGEELIVVIPAIGRKTLPDVSKILIRYMDKFKKVLHKSLCRLHPGDGESAVPDAISARHTLVSEDSSFMEFACCVTNHPECKNFEHEVTDVRVLDMSWQQGAGI
jgi:hypothetical protein